MIYNIYYYIGKILESRKKWDLAIKNYHKAYNKDSAIINYRLGFCYEKRKDFGNAIYFFKKAISIEDKKAHWYYHIANAYIGISKDGLAARYLRLAMLIDPKNKKFEKKYQMIRNRLEEGIPEIDTFVSDIKEINKNSLKFIIKGHVDKDYDVNSLRLLLNTRNNSIEKESFYFEFTPDKIDINSEGVYCATFTIEYSQLNIRTMVVSHVFDLNIVADQKYRVQYFKKTANLYKTNDCDFITYATTRKNFGLIVVRTKYISDTEYTKEHIVFTLPRLQDQTGVAKTIISLANNLVALSYKVTIVVLDFTGAPNQFRILPQVNFDYVSPALFRSSKKRLNFNSSGYVPSDFLDEIDSFFSSLDCDLIYNPVYGAKFLSSIINALPRKIIKILGDHTGRHYEVYDRLLKNTQDITINSVIKLTKDKHYFSNISKVDAVHIVNPLAESIFRSITNKYIIPIPNIVEQNGDKRAFFSREKKIILIGRLEKNKNFITAIKAYKKLLLKYPDWSLELYGEGEYRKDIEKIINTLNLDSSKILKGFTSNVYEQLSESSIHLSISDREAFGLTLVESMNAGCIAISTRKTIGARYIIENNKTGYLADDNSVDDVYNILSKVVKQVEEKDIKLLEIQRNAYIRGSYFSNRNIIKEWIVAFNELKRRKKNKRGRQRYRRRYFYI